MPWLGRRRFVGRMLWRYQDHADEEAGHQAADVGGEVCGSADGAVDEVVDEEDSCGPADGLRYEGIEVVSADQKEAEDGAVEAEDGS